MHQTVFIAILTRRFTGVGEAGQSSMIAVGVLINTSPLDYTETIRCTTQKRLHFTPGAIGVTHCWHTDPAMRPGFDTIVMGLASYMSKTDKTSYDARSRVDTNSIGMVDSGYGVSTPSTGTASKSSTRSRTVSKCSELSWLPSSSSSQVWAKNL